MIDIGCGCSGLSKEIINISKQKKINLVLLDIAPVINNIKNKNKFKKIKFIKGKFQNIKFKKKYDFVLIYSVIHYVNNPHNFIKKAFNILAEGGKMLIGDIPNINKKKRFINSFKGKKI